MAAAAEGGYTVATEYYRQLTEAMKAFGGIRSVATIIQTGTGAQMNFPTADATSEEGEIVGQNAAVALGETSRYIIREVMDLTLFRMADSAFILNGQIGFVAFNRQGGRLVDVGGAVKHYANSAT